MNASTDRRFITVAEAARLMEIHPNTVRNMVNRGDLIDARIPGTNQIRIDAQQVEDLICSRATYDRNSETPCC